MRRLPSKHPVCETKSQRLSGQHVIILTQKTQSLAVDGICTVVMETTHTSCHISMTTEPTPSAGEDCGMHLKALKKGK